MLKKFVAYYRVSTNKQGVSGLGLEAQQQAVVSYLNGGQWELLKEFTEVETGKGNNALQKRPVLKDALDFCKKNKATLIIAKLDRLARNLHFISGLMEAKVSFVACDLPEANELTIHVFAAFAQHESKMISERTKAALQAAKARGVKLGNPNLNNCRPFSSNDAVAFAENLRPVLTAFIQQGLTQRNIIKELDALNIKTPRGKSWSLLQLQTTLKRLHINTKSAK